MGPYIFEVHIGGVEGGQVQINNQIFVGGEDPIDDSGVLVVPTKFCGIRWITPLSYNWYKDRPGNLVETLPFDPDPILFMSFTTNSKLCQSKIETGSETWANKTESSPAFGVLNCLLL